MQGGKKSGYFYIGVPETGLMLRVAELHCLHRSFVMSQPCTSSWFLSAESLRKLSRVPVTRRTRDAADLGFDPGGIFLFESYLLLNVSLSD